MNQDRIDEIPFLGRVSDYVDYYSKCRPDREAVVCGSLRWSFRELKAHVDKIARALLAAGVERGDRVATLSPPNHEFFSIFLATASIGAIWVGLNPRYTLKEYQYVISDAEPKILFSRNVVGERTFSADIRILKEQSDNLSHVVFLDECPKDLEVIQFFDFCEKQVSAQELQEARKRVQPQDPALIVYTSGSTGRPKGAILPHRGLVRCSRNQIGHYDISPVRLENFFPINHVACVGDVSCFCLITGGTVFFLEKFDPAESLAQIEREKITLWGGIPTTLQLCLLNPSFGKYDLSSIQLISWGGAAASEELIDRLLEISPRLTSCYGLTETVGSVTFVEPTADKEILTSSVGSVVSDYEMRLVDEQGADVDDGEQGEILVRGDFIMKGYWNRPEATKETIDDAGWLHTDDLALKRSDGNLKLLGRKGDMFKSGGYNIYPREVEKALEDCPGIDMACVFGVPDPLYGEVGVAFVQRQHATDIEANEVSEHCKTLLANYKIPKQIFLVDQLPLLPVGKIDKSALKTQYQDKLASSF